MELDDKEDKTKYGEFVCSEFKWIPIEKQKDIAKKLSKITENKNDNKNKKEKK